MSLNRKSVILGILPALVIAGSALYKSHEIINSGQHGMIVLLSCLFAAALAWLGIAIKPDRSAKWYPLALAAFFFIAPMINVMCVERMNGNFLFDLWHLCWIDNYCVALLLYLLAFAISGSVRGTTIFVSTLLFVLGLANMYVKEFKGGPLVPMDVGSIATATTVAGGFTYDLGAEVVFALAFTIMVIAISSRLRMPRQTLKIKVTSRVAAFAVVAVMAGLFYGTDVFVKLGYRPDFFNQTRGYEHSGVILNFTENTRYLRLSRPSGYDAENIEDKIADQLQGNSPVPIIQTALNNAKTLDASGVKNPDIVVIMDEAFSDLSVIGDFKTNGDPVAFMNRMKDETLQGYAYVSVLGSGTSNTEFEFLTGNTMAFLAPGSNAYQLYVKSSQPGMVKLLKSKGYTVQALHPYFKANWNRPNVYKYMGFDAYRAIEDMFDSEELDYYKNDSGAYLRLRKKLEEKYGDDSVLLRKYVSDSYDFKELIRMQKKAGSEDPYFMFNVTMQNHSPYNLYMLAKERRIKLQGMGGEFPKTEQYLSIIKRTDDALEELIEYYSKVTRPTIILFFGDHQPFIESDFYKEVMGSSMSELSDEEKMKCYATRFMLWANYDIPTGWVEKISMNYLGVMMAEVAGLKLTDYQKYLEKLYAKYPVVTALGGFDSDGDFFNIEEDGSVKYPGSGEKRKKALNLYQQLVYNNLIDTENRKMSMFE